VANVKTGLPPGEFDNLTMDSLPPPDTKRWIIRRKAMIVAALRQGLLTRDEACQRYNLSLHEIDAWEELSDRHGLPGLRVTHLKRYRGPTPQIPRRPTTSTTPSTPVGTTIPAASPLARHRRS
jgi:hypothetical protein